MRSPNVGQIIAEAWEDSILDQAYREEHQITELHRWERARNGVWVERGYLMCPARERFFFLSLLRKPSWM